MTEFKAGRSRGLGSLMAACAWCALAAPAIAGLTLTVNSTADAVDALPGNGPSPGLRFFETPLCR